MQRRDFVVLTGLATVGCLAPTVRDERFDLVVYGATPAGIAAAIEAARRGLRVVLIEPTRHVGGLTASGLGATDIGNKAAIGGIAREFYRSVRRWYDEPSAWTHERRDEFKGVGHHRGEDAAWSFEPHVAEALFESLLAETSVELVRGERLDLERGVEMRGAQITALVTRGGRRFRGELFVDASYEGDVLAGARCSYRIGRESNAEYGESLNGVQVANALKHQFKVRVDPFRVRGDRASGLLPGICADAPRPDGSGDRKVQAYCFRLCATNDATNRIEWAKPVGYDPALYELLLRNFEAGDDFAPWHPLFMPNRKTDSNNNGAVSTDWIGMNWNYAEASWEERDALVAAHADYQQGLMWTLAHHERVPAKVREHFASFGLCKDEFVDNGGWPRQLYVREARRLVGEHVMTEHECRGARRVARPIGLAAYTMDSHNVQRYVDASGSVRNEGDVQVGGFAPYGIDLGALLPRRDQCRNLLVPVCLSASHIAYGSIRMEPVFMVTGQSAAIAASLSLELGCALHDLDYAVLRRRLLDAGQILEWPAAR